MANKKYDRRISKIKNIVKNEKKYIEKCKEYNKPIGFIDTIDVSFEPLDVSAKTINGKVYLNEKLYHRPIDDQIRYTIHELVHCLQQEAGLVDSKKTDDYLDDENEQEAFNAQISYMCEHDSPEEVQNYIENLLDHHNIKGEERKEKAKELVKDIK